MQNRLILLLVILAGETIFMLPFGVPRLFRPLMIESWGLSNTTIGLAFSAYGFSAMVSYILGGPIADKYGPRVLISTSLLITGILGILLYHFHTPVMMISIYFLFGISTILLMWSAMLKLTHLIGGEDNRTLAMGILDSGRGLLAAIVSSIILGTVSYFISGDLVGENSKSALFINYTIVICTTFTVALIVWFGLKNTEFENTEAAHKWELSKAIEISKNFNIWLLGLIILTSYCAYKSVDIYSIYLVDIHKLKVSEASSVTNLSFWLRPVGALMAGYLVDWSHQRFKNVRFNSMTALLLIAAILQFILLSDQYIIYNFVLTSILLGAFIAYALRAVYFSVLGDLKIPDHLVGTTVGVASLVGYLPDLFFGTLTGYLIDQNPGATGYHYCFIFVGSMLFIGSLSCFILGRRA